MVSAIQASLDEIVDLTEAMLTMPFAEEEQSFVEVVHRNAVDLRDEQVFNLTLTQLSTKSHGLRQYITGVVGYSALLNSPKLADHASLSPQQLEKIYALHDSSRRLHWWLDSLILFASYIVRPEPRSVTESGMLNIRGYLLAQADHHLCRQHIQKLNVPEEIPLVFANDARTKLMLRGLFTAALEIRESPMMQLFAYTVMKVVRVRLHIQGAADTLKQIAPYMAENEPDAGDNSTPTPPQRPASFKDTISQNLTPKSTTLLELGLQIAVDLAAKQHGRIKAEADQNDLVFTLTMPTGPQYAKTSDA